jgi:capsular polysaccharide biosynthesis protein
VAARPANAAVQQKPDTPTDVPKSSIKVVSLAKIPTAHALVEICAGERYSRMAPTRVHYGDPAAEAFQNHYTNLRGRLPRQSVFELPNVVVQGKGTMLIGDALVRDNLEGAPVARALKGSHLEPVRTLDRPTLYTTRYGVLNYGHCLTDIVPRIVETSRAIPDCDIALHPQFVPAAREALLALGVDSSRLVELDEMPTRLERGLFASPCSAHPLVHSPRALELVGRLAETFVDAAPGPSAPTKLFVSCDDATARRITNYAEVESFLVDLGYTPITVGALDLATQVRTFANAGEVVGIAGAAMTNMLFCAPGTRITVLSSSSMPALHLWDFAAQSRHDYRIGYFAAHTPARRFYSRFSVGLDALASLLLP